MRANFDVTVPRKDNTSAGEAVNQLAAPEQGSAPIPITRAREAVTQVGPWPMERRTDPVRLQLCAQLARAEQTEARFRQTLQQTQTDMLALADDLKGALKRLTHAEQRVSEKQRVLKQLMKRVTMLESEREAASKARESLEALQQQYDAYFRLRTPLTRKNG